MHIYVFLWRYNTLALKKRPTEIYVVIWYLIKFDTSVSNYFIATMFIGDSAYDDSPPPPNDGIIISDI